MVSRMKMRAVTGLVAAIAAIMTFSGCRGMSGESVVISDEIPVGPAAELQIDDVTGSIQIAGENRVSIGMDATVTDSGFTSTFRYVDVNDVTITGYSGAPALTAAGDAGATAITPPTWHWSTW